jgi:hypothetical protein
MGGYLFEKQGVKNCKITICRPTILQSGGKRKGQNREFLPAKALCFHLSAVFFSLFCGTAVSPLCSQTRQKAAGSLSKPAALGRAKPSLF